MMLSATTARRGSPDPAEGNDRRSPKRRETYGHAMWLGRETGHNLSCPRSDYVVSQTSVIEQELFRV